MSHLWLNTDSNIFLMSECLRLIVYFLWHYDTAAVTFHSPLSCVQPLAPSINLFISAINWNAGVKKGKDGETKRNASSRYFLLRLNILLWRVFFIFLDLPYSRFVLLQLISIFPLKIISHPKKGFKKKTFNIFLANIDFL